MVSEAKRHLQRSYGEVRKLYDDIQRPVFARQDWGGTVYARRSLGDDVRVEVWYLAEHFLLRWGDWEGLCQRYLLYFGQPENAFPRAWDTLVDSCRALAHRLVHDGRLDQFVAKSWHRWAVETIAPEAPSGDVRTAYHSLIDAHRWLAMLGRIRAPAAEAAMESGHEISQSPVWPEASAIAERRNQALLHEWIEVSQDLREQTLWHLQHYQRSNLLTSWLTEDGDDGRNGTHSALLHILRKEQPVTPTIEQFISQLNVETQQRDRVRRVLDRVGAAILDFGYENFAEDVTSGEFMGGDASAVGSGEINLVPGQAADACRTILLAVSRGDKKALGFPSVMKQVRAHLIRCIDKTWVVIITCDHWFPGMLDDHRDDLRAHHKRGVRFLFLMAGSPERGIAPVAVDLGPTGTQDRSTPSEPPPNPDPRMPSRRISSGPL